MDVLAEYGPEIEWRAPAPSPETVLAWTREATAARDYFHALLREMVPAFSRGQRQQWCECARRFIDLIEADMHTPKAKD